MKRRSTLVLLVAISMVATFISGCGGGGSSTVGPTTGGGGVGPGLVLGQATIFGRATMDSQPIEGAAISVISGDGSTLPLAERSTTGHGGAFVARLAPSIPSGAFSVVVTTANGEVFDTEVEGIADGRSVFVHVNALTTLCRAYHARHPDMSIADARSKVHSYVGIRPRFDLGDQVASPYYSMFSSQVFMGLARQHPGGLAAYLASVVEGIDARAERSTGSRLHALATDPSNGIVPYVDWQNFIDAIVPEWESGVERTIAPATTAAEEVAEDFSLGTAIGDGLIDSVIGLVVDHIPGVGICSDLTAIQNQIAQVQSQLNQIVGMLGSLATMLGQEFNQVEYTTLSSSLNSQTQDIKDAYAQLQQIQADAYGVAPAHTPITAALSTDVQALYANSNWVNTQIEADAGTLHQVQSLGTPGNQPLMYLAMQLTNTNNFLGITNMGLLQSQMNYYQGLQVQALNLLGALNAPASYNVIGQNTPAGLRLQAARWIAQISGNIAQELMQQPFPPYTQNYFADIPNAMLYQNASVSLTGSGAEVTYAGNLTDGGMSWQVAGNPSLQDTFNLVNQITSNSNQSISTWLNTNLGANLKPGPVTYYSSKYPTRYGQPPITATSNGFVTISAVPTSTAGQFNFTVGWIDDHGKSGTLGTDSGTWASLATDLDSGYYSIYFGSATGGYAALIKGPCIIMRASDNSSTAAFGSSVVLGQYTGLTISNPADAGSGTNPFVPDPYSGGSSGTISLHAYTTTTPSIAQSFDLSDDVYWTSSDPTNAPISNVPVGPTPTTTPAFPALPMSPGTIHWLPGSFGETVTFTAQRRRPQDPAGTFVQATIQLPSPVTGSAPSPQAVSVWPSRYNVIASNWSEFATNGLQLYATRYYGSGDCEDVGSNVTYTLGPNFQGFTISPQGWISTTLPAKPAAGTTLVITVTDPQVPAATSEGNVRQTDTLTLTFN